MTDKRLKEIKDSIDLQLEVAKVMGLNHVLKEEKELYEYVKELKKELEEANKKLYLCTPEIPQNVHEKYVSYVDLVNEIYELKKQLQTKDEGFKAVNEELREYAEENEKLRNQLEYCYCNRTDCSGRIKGSKQYDSLVQKVETQQQKFINWLEKEIAELDSLPEVIATNLCGSYKINQIEIDVLQDTLNKYKEIVGVKDEF